MLLDAPIIEPQAPDGKRQTALDKYLQNWNNTQILLTSWNINAILTE